MRRALTYWIVWTIAWIIARTVFLMRVKGARNMPRTGPVIVVANHTSHLDPPLVAVALHTRRIIHIRDGLITADEAVQPEQRRLARPRLAAPLPDAQPARPAAAPREVTA